jgi:hypothetical protein
MNKVEISKRKREKFSYRSSFSILNLDEEIEFEKKRVLFLIKKISKNNLDSIQKSN